jgi:hypothetical protein
MSTTALSGIARNRCPPWIGISVRIQSESLSDIIGIRNLEPVEAVVAAVGYRDARPSGTASAKFYSHRSSGGNVGWQLSRSAGS